MSFRRSFDLLSNTAGGHGGGYSGLRQKTPLSISGFSIAIFAFYSRVKAKEWPKPAIISAAFPPGFEMEEDGQETLLQRQDLGKGTMARHHHEGLIS